MKRISFVPATLLALVITLGASACGDDGPNETTDSTAETSETPGTTEASETTGASETTDGAGTTDAPDTTDADNTSEPAVEPTVESATDVVVGSTLADATEAAEEQGWILRVTREDGEDLPATMDLRPNRVNVEVTDGAVIAVLNIG